MVTRLYFRADQTPAKTPAFDAGWQRTTEAVRRVMEKPRIASSMTDFTAWNGASVGANGNALAVQFQSPELTPGQNISTSHTVKMQVRCREESTNDNIIACQIALKVYNGTTLQATLLPLITTPVTSYGTVAEWTAAGTDRRNVIAANGDAIQDNYVTVDGDYLVLEVGAQVSTGGGTGVTATLVFGSDNASDLPEDDIELSALNPWIELSNDLTFGSGKVGYAAYYGLPNYY